MRKLIALFFILMLLALPRAEASIPNMTGQLGVYNTTDTTYGEEVDNNNTFHYSLTGSSIYYPTQSNTTNQTLTVNQSGQIIDFFGTSTHTQFTLPASVPGMDYYIVAGVAKSFSVEIQSTDTIDFTGESIGKGISNSSAAQGDMIELFCTFTGHWLVKDKLGTWAAGN